MTFNPLADIGVTTADGGDLGVSSDGYLWLRKGRRVAILILQPLQFQLLSVGLTKFEQPHNPKGAVTVECTNKWGHAATIKVSKARYPDHVRLTARVGANEVSVVLIRQTADLLKEEARRRTSMNTHQPA